MSEILERRYQSKLIKILKEMFDGCMVLKLDTSYIQGLPDLLILYRDRWATLECKAGPDSRLQSNQLYYVEQMDSMSFSRIIYPEIQKEVLDDLQRSFEY